MIQLHKRTSEKSLKREPWEMTSAEFEHFINDPPAGFVEKVNEFNRAHPYHGETCLEFDTLHNRMVKQAIADKLPVPDRVLQEKEC